MSGYPDIAHGEASKEARPLYLELRALGLDVWVEEDAEDPTGYRIILEGSGSIPRPRIEHLVPRVRENKSGLIKVLLFRCNPDLHAIRTEGFCR
jgi:hypothetical protein